MFLRTSRAHLPYEKRKEILFCFLTLLINYLDAFFTIKYVKNGILEELNPIMAYFLQEIWSFLLIKTVFVPFLLFFLLILSYNKFAKHAIIIAMIFYVMVLSIWIYIIA